jgi:hypothetical protein
MISEPEDDPKQKLCTFQTMPERVNLSEYLVSVFHPIFIYLTV